MEVPTWQQIITLGGIFALIITIRYWMIEKSKQNKELDERKQIIKEILNLLEQYPHLFDDGLCNFMILLRNIEIISEEKCEQYRQALRDNSPYELFPKEFPIMGAYWFYNTDIKKAISVRIEYLKRLLNE